MKFTKAHSEQAKFKAGFYGKQGSGKTLTALLVAEGLAAACGKRVAYVDTERGTDFYTIAIPERRVHPVGFDFDSIATKSISETLEAIAELDTRTHGVVVVDSITHIWEAAQAAYNGKRLPNGEIPIHAWGPIKRPYKQLMAALLDGDFHVIICGREGVIMEEDEDGKTHVIGAKMKAEGETPYEPHILVRMRSVVGENQSHTISAFVEKDRSGILTGKTIDFPNYGTFDPIIRYLSAGPQGTAGSADENAAKDAAAIEAATERDLADRQSLYAAIHTAIVSSSTLEALKAAWDLTKGKKTKLADLYAQLESAKDSRKLELVRC